VKVLLGVAIVTAGAVAAFAVYTFGWSGSTVPTTTTTRAAQHTFTLREGDTVLVPATATRCEVTHEAGIPNWFCERTHQSRYEVVIWKDRADLYDLARHGEPMVPTFSVPAVLK